MAQEKIIAKNQIQKLVASLRKGHQVFAPVKTGSAIVFAEVHAGDEISLPCANTKKSVKELFFPQRELLFSFAGQEIKEPAFVEKKRIIFGIRPCDARSLSLLDQVFAGEQYQDPYYLSKRDHTVIVAIGCNQPEETCFCSSTGGDPFSAEGSDVLMVDSGDYYVAQAVTERGATLLEHEGGFEKADQNRTALKDKTLEKSCSLLEPLVKPEKIKTKLAGNFNHPFWETLHEKCLGCGICTFLCPTCHCFDVIDETGRAAGARIRIWDSCMFPLFTAHASGANPRPSGKERMRQRVMHKFNYFVDRHGAVACVGCGRCVKYCPVNLDIREVLQEIQRQL